jgi:hypothetical protein
VKSRFQSLPFKCNLQRYTAGFGLLNAANAAAAAAGDSARQAVVKLESFAASSVPFDAQWAAVFDKVLPADVSREERARALAAAGEKDLGGALLIGIKLTHSP